MRKAVLCFLQKNDKVLLLKTEYKDKVVWNGISGYVDKNETPEEAAVREVFEEIGVKINPSQLGRIGTHKAFDIFVVKKWIGVPKPKEESIKKLKWF